MWPALQNLQKAGCKWVVFGGSFITNEPFPHDVDAVWHDKGINFSQIDRVLLSRDPTMRAMTEKYGGQFFAQDLLAPPNGTGMLNFFRYGRNGMGKGVVLLDLAMPL
jgi:hypothetical protein